VIVGSITAIASGLVDTFRASFRFCQVSSFSALHFDALIVGNNASGVGSDNDEPPTQMAGTKQCCWNRCPQTIIPDLGQSRQNSVEGGAINPFAFVLVSWSASNRWRVLSDREPGS